MGCYILFTLFGRIEGQRKILNGETFTFFKNNNRGDSGNCQFISEDLFSGLISVENEETYLNDVIEYQNTEGKVFFSHLWFDKIENCLMIGGIPYHKLFNGWVLPMVAQLITKFKIQTK